MSAHRTHGFEALQRELDRRGAEVVRLPAWDAFILGETDRLESRVLSAREAARAELLRWRAGRFPSLAVALGDAVFSTRKGYAAAIRAATRPFALAVGGLSLAEFHALDQAELCRRTYGREARPEKARSHQSREGRLRTIHEAARVFLAHAADSPAAARRALSAPGWRRGIGASLRRVTGLGEARLAKIRRNVGILAFQPSPDVRAILAPYLGLPATAAVREFERRLARVKRVFGMVPFEVERVLWYTRAA